MNNRIIKIVLCTLLLVATGRLVAQNRYEEEIPFEKSTGKIVLPVTIQGEPYPFALDLQHTGSSAITEQLAKKLNLTATSGQKVSVEKVGLGEGIFLQTKQFTVMPDQPFAGTTIEGTIGSEFFKDYVLTIDWEQNQLLLSAPFKPEYVHTRNRTDLNASTTSFPVEIHGKKINVRLNLLEPALAINENDYKTIFPSGSGKQSAAIKVIQSQFQAEVGESTSNSYIGTLLLEQGLLSLDYQRSKIYLEPYSTLERPEKTTARQEVVIEGGNPIDINTAGFLSNIYDFRQENQWNYKGNKPAIIDFWAEWCGPCKKLSPILAELAGEYKDDILVYKVNVDEEPEIARYFKANSIPMLVYIPVNGQPVTIIGSFPKENIEKNIKEILLK